jgi:hypothetical protein
LDRPALETGFISDAQSTSFAKSPGMDMIDDFIARHQDEYKKYLTRMNEKDSARIRALFSYGHSDYMKFEDEFYQKAESEPTAENR